MTHGRRPAAARVHPATGCNPHRAALSNSEANHSTGKEFQNSKKKDLTLGGTLTMNPSKVDRSRTRTLTDLPNVGPAMARDLEFIGVRAPKDIVGKDPLELYEMLCSKSGCRQDPCVLDIFMSIADWMSGHKPRPWWEYTAERKRRYAQILEKACST